MEKIHKENLILDTLGLNMRGCLWGVDDFGNLLMKKGEGWENIKDPRFKHGIKSIALNEQNLWMISLDGEVFLIKNIS